MGQTIEKAIKDILFEMRNPDAEESNEAVEALQYFADRIERAWKRERDENFRRWEEFDPVQGEDFVREHLDLLVDWEKAPKDAEYAQVRLHYFLLQVPRDMDTEFHRELARFERPKPAWVPKKGERVRGWVGNESITGPYQCPGFRGEGHQITWRDTGLWVERVEPLTKEG